MADPDSPSQLEDDPMTNSRLVCVVASWGAPEYSAPHATDTTCRRTGRSKPLISLGTKSNSIHRSDIANADTMENVCDPVLVQ